MGCFMLNSRNLFFLYTYSYFVPVNTGLFVIRRWKMQPTENMSQAGEYCSFCWIVMIYGATNPGVPHRKNKYGTLSDLAANPKSTMTGS